MKRFLWHWNAILSDKQKTSNQRGLKAGKSQYKQAERGGSSSSLLACKTLHGFPIIVMGGHYRTERRKLINLLSNKYFQKIPLAAVNSRNSKEVRMMTSNGDMESINYVTRDHLWRRGNWLKVYILCPRLSDQIRSDQSLSHVWLFATPWIAACQASLSITNSRSSLRLTSIESVMPSSHLILCHPLLLLPPIPPSIRVFSNESTLRMRWPKYWSFSFSIIPSKEISGLIFLRMDWLDLLADSLPLNYLGSPLIIMVL